MELLPAAKEYKTLRVVLIKPSKYDDNGYVIRFWRGVLPSNTLNVLHGLTVDIAERRVLGDIEIRIDTFDETVEKVPVKKIVKWSRRSATKLVVCLVGVQTNQFPRALDLGREFRTHGLDVILGGFHTSGTINMLSEKEPDIQELVRESIIVVSGEVEGYWGGILADILNGRPKRIYSFAQDLKSLVDIEKAPLPVMSPTTMKHFARSSFGTVETSRGCPFTCSFCSIINVQGRTMRERSPEWIVDLIRRNYRKHGIDFYFFTDDNFARKKSWREIFEALIRLRKEEGIKVSFMMQVDLARKPKDFVRLAAEAGCSQVFMGMESVNPQNLKVESKAQNKVEAYQEIIREWHEAGIAVHAAYIIGLPFDTKEQVPKDIQYLMDVIQPDQASFFMLTPIPGSQDHVEIKKRGEWLDPDFNKRDSFHATVKHPHMTAEEWSQAYRNAWTAFYGKENLIKILARWTHNPSVYWSLIFVHMWYKNAALIEKEHPMIAGFFRLKDRLSRRPGFAIDPWPVHMWKRTKDVIHLAWSWICFLKEMEEIWLQTRPRSDREKQFCEEIERIQGEIWRTLKIAEWQKTYNDAKASLPAKARALLDPFEDLASKILLSPKDLDAFLEKWGSLQTRTQELYRRVAGDPGPTKRWLDRLAALHKEAWQNPKVQEWRDAYEGFRDRLPSRLQLLYVKFDAVSNRVVYSRQDLRRVWARTWEHLHGKQFWGIRPTRLAVACVKEVVLTTAFTLRVIASFQPKY
ncbi:MAG TPA: radical SAM protein [Candidatus Methylomirabilis sp.]|nr:radical SAM protein [Candidatus Methylomirabilis sp.]